MRIYICVLHVVISENENTTGPLPSLDISVLTDGSLNPIVFLYCLLQIMHLRLWILLQFRIAHVWMKNESSLVSLSFVCKASRRMLFALFAWRTCVTNYAHRLRATLHSSVFMQLCVIYSFSYSSLFNAFFFSFLSYLYYCQPQTQ